jgi:uncharacterized protein with ParB-like and HNH nuclease domain
MKAGPIEIGKLLQNPYRYCVPIYQRHYVWRRQRQWEPFWNDIRSKAMERPSGRERRFSHYMGALVLESRGGFSANLRMQAGTNYPITDEQALRLGAL